jgi:hypothetical protein
MFDCKTVSETGQTRRYGTRQKQKFLSLIKPQHNFYIAKCFMSSMLARIKFIFKTFFQSKTK